MGATKSGAVVKERWTADRILAEGRRRMTDLMEEPDEKVQAMLGDLLAEAGWDEVEFLDVLGMDVAGKTLVRVC